MLPVKLFKKRFHLFILKEMGREGERKGEKHRCVVASHAHPTGDPLVCRTALNPLSHTSQGMTVYAFLSLGILISLSLKDLFRPEFIIFYSCA